jgi:hypothetical protein
MIARRFLVLALAAGLLVGAGVPGSRALAAKPTAGAAAKHAKKPKRWPTTSPACAIAAAGGRRR